MGIFISQYKDPYKTTSIMESRRVFFVAQFMPSLWFGHKTRYCNWSNVDMKDYMRRSNSSQKRKVLANVDMEDTLFQDFSMGFYC